MDKQKTGELIKNARIKKGYTQVELGDLLGLTFLFYPTISLIKGDGRQFSQYRCYRRVIKNT